MGLHITPELCSVNKLWSSTPAFRWLETLRFSKFPRLVDFLGVRKGVTFRKLMYSNGAEIGPFSPEKPPGATHLPAPNGYLSGPILCSMLAGIFTVG